MFYAHTKITYSKITNHLCETVTFNRLFKRSSGRKKDIEEKPKNIFFIISPLMVAVNIADKKQLTLDLL